MKSAWRKGVEVYAQELLESLEGREATKENMLNGSKDWMQYSYGGCALIYDADIAERLCTPSELKRKKGGDLPPNRDESWLDCQARALSKACHIAIRMVNAAKTYQAS